MKKRILILAVGFIFIANLGSAQSLTDDPQIKAGLKLIEIWVDAQLAYGDIPGMSIGIVDDQDLIWSRGFGYAHKDRKIPAAPGTIYSICSISKLFTSISVMQLRDLGKLSLDEAVGKYLPWFNIKDTFPDAPEITLRGILTHSSGLPREADFPYWTGPEYAFPTREQIIERLSGQDELYPAFTYFQYSNLGMALAGEVIASVSGMPYADYVRKNILEPLGLKDTTPEIPAQHKGGKLATGYSARLRDGKRRVMPFYHVKGMAPAAGFASTVEDLARFASWQFRVLKKEDREILAPNTLKEMQRVHWVDEDWETKWGLGFSISRHSEKTFVGHGGSCPGYRTQLYLCPRDRLAIIVMTNGADVSPAAYARQIFDIMAPAVEKARKGSEPAKPSDPGLEKFVGRYDRPLGWETQIIIWKGELAMVSLPTDTPLRSLTKLRRVGDNTFKRIRSNGDLGEAVVFELGPDGRVTRMIRNSNYAVRVYK